MGTNSGDQTTIVGITGTLLEFNTALAGADFATGGGTATGTNTGDNAPNSNSDTYTDNQITTHAALQTGVHGISIAATKTFTANNSLTLSGTDGTTMTFPTTTATIARTDAAQTFTGTQTFSTSPIISSLTSGSIPFVGASKELAEDNTNFYWDNTNKWLGIGTNAPSAPLTVIGDVNINATSSTLASPRTIGIIGVPGWTDGNAARVTFGDAWNALQNGYGQRMQIVAYHGVDISGSRESATPLGFVAGSGNDASLNVIGTVNNNPVLTISAPAGQSVNLQEWIKGGTTLANINSSGVFVSNVATGTAPFTVTSTTPVANLSIGGSAATATAASNIAGGAAGSIPYQSGPGATTLLPIGAAGYVLRSNGTNAPYWDATAGTGDMLTTAVQSVTGLKTFDDSKLAMRGTSTGVTTILTANTSATNYSITLPAQDGTVALLTAGKLPSSNLPAGTMILLHANESNISGTVGATGARSYSLSANTYSYIIVEAEVALEYSGGTDADWSFVLNYGGTGKETSSLRSKGVNAGDAHKTIGVLKYSEAFTSGGNITLDVNVVSASGTWWVRGFRVYGVI